MGKPPKQLEPHPFAELLPRMSDAEYAALFADLLANGQRDDVILFEGKILDGRNRYRALREMKKPPRTRKFKGTREDAVAFVKSRMMHRNLDAPRKACVAIQFADTYEQEAKARMVRGKQDPSKKVYEGQEKAQRAMDLLGEAFGVNPTYLYQAKKLRDGDKKLFRAVFEGVKPLPVAVREFTRREKSKAIAAKTTQVRQRFVGDKRPYTLVVGDCAARLAADKPHMARLIFADPPYNEGIDYGRGRRADAMKEDKYAAFCDGWIEQCARTLASDGSFFVMNSVRNLRLMLDLGAKHKLHLRNVICWSETFGNYTPGNFSPCWRPICYFTKSRDTFVWHGDQVLIESDRLKKYGDKRANPEGKVPSNVWTEFPRLVDNAKERVAGFPTQLPLALVERIVLVASNPGDYVLDPFNGSGTTGEACLRHARPYVGIDLEAKNVGVTIARLNRVANELK
jgi:DNA modification methylase